MTQTKRDYWAFPVVPVFGQNGQKTGEWKPSGQLPTMVHSRDACTGTGTRIYPARPGEDAQAAFDECVEHIGFVGWTWTNKRPNATRYVARPKAEKALTPATESMVDFADIQVVRKPKKIAKKVKTLA